MEHLKLNLRRTDRVKEEEELVDNRKVPVSVYQQVIGGLTGREDGSVLRHRFKVILVICGPIGKRNLS